MKRKAALLRITVLAVVVTMIAAGGLGMYFYTLPPGGATGTTTLRSTSTDQLLTNTVQGQQYITVEYNGTSYQVPAKGSNSPSFPCPTGTAPALCTLLQETCGNGVGHTQEPWKTCYNCAFDAGCSGDNSCDPYTHECSSPATACMVVEGYGGP